MWRPLESVWKVRPERMVDDRYSSTTSLPRPSDTGMGPTVHSTSKCAWPWYNLGLVGEGKGEGGEGVWPIPHDLLACS